MSYDMIATGDRWWSKASQIVKEDYGQECFHIKFKQKSKFNMILILIRYFFLINVYSSVAMNM